MNVSYPNLYSANGGSPGMNCFENAQLHAAFTLA